MDTTKLITLTQEFMAFLEAVHPDDEIVEVGIVVELRTPENECPTPTACTSDSRVYQMGLFDCAYNNAMHLGEPADDEVPGPDDE